MPSICQAHWRVDSSRLVASRRKKGARVQMRDRPWLRAWARVWVVVVVEVPYRSP